MIAPHADVVGMTIASECVDRRRAGARYAAVCIVDNLANGVGEGDAHGRGVRGRAGAEPRAAAAPRVARGRPGAGAVGP